MEPISGGRFCRVCGLLAGLEVGIWGAVAMLVWFGFGSASAHRSMWTAPDLLSVLIYRHPVRPGFSGATLPGLALHLATSGAVGAVFGLMIRDMSNRLRIRLLGIAVGLVWYYLSVGLFWRSLGAAVAQYLSPGILLVGYLIFGLFLGLYPSRLVSATRHFAREAPAMPSARQRSIVAPPGIG